MSVVRFSLLWHREGGGMPKEVSAYMANLTIEAGEYFGLDGSELKAFFSDPAALSHRWKRVDWNDYHAMASRFFSEVGQGESLIPVGQEYLRECFKFRNTHLVAQYTQWDKILWVTKHFLCKRLMQGYELDYVEVGPDTFDITMRLDDSLKGSADWLYFMTGVWTGSSRLSDLHHDIQSLKVEPNIAVATIHFDQRSTASKAVHNPWRSRWKTLRHLKQDQKEQQKLLQELEQESENLARVLESVSDAVLIGSGETLELTNPAGKKVTDHLDQHPSQLVPQQRVEAEGRIYSVRDKVTSDKKDSGDWMLTLQDITEISELKKEVREAPERVRSDVRAALSETLGREIDVLERQLKDLQQNLPESPLEEHLQSLEELTVLSREQAAALVQNHLPEFDTTDAWMNGVRKLATETTTVFGFKVHLDVHGPPDLTNKQQRGELYLIIQEAIRNAIRHSGGTEVTLTGEPERIIISDNGSGLLDGMASGSGLGCDSIQKRAETLNARATPLPPPENGWCIDLRSGEDTP